MKYREFMDACERDLLVETIVHIEDENGAGTASAEAVAGRLAVSSATVFRKFIKHGISRVNGRYVIPRCIIPALDDTAKVPDC